jgi:uncharacterized protein HemX
MVLTHYETIIAALVGIVTLLVILLTALRWIYRQGSANAEQVIATRQNTTATQELSKTLKAFTEKTDGTIMDHEKRITRLEDHEDTRGKQGRQP